MPEKNFAKTKVTCRHHTPFPIFCVKSDQPVPPQVRCIPAAGGGGVSGSGGGPTCDCVSNLGPGELERRVAALTPPWNRWIKLGFVVIDL